MTGTFSPTSQWNPGSWQGLPIFQQPEYEDVESLEAIYQILAKAPGLVSNGRIEALRSRLSEVAMGKRFLLQGGDCAEKFSDSQRHVVRRKVQVLWQMSAIIEHNLHVPSLILGRIAGQYAKPRSHPTELGGGDPMVAFRGDAVNSLEHSSYKRKPKPERLLMAYYYSKKTLLALNKIINDEPDVIAKVGSLRNQEGAEKKYVNLIKKLNEATRTWKIRDKAEQNAFKASFEYFSQDVEHHSVLGQLREKYEEVNSHRDIFTSHECLLLGYEQALTRWVPGALSFYNLGAHLLWIGDRTRQIKGAHLEYARGLKNPLGVKIGPSTTPDDLEEIVLALNPHFENNKLVLITRLGVNNVEKILPSLIKRVQKIGNPVIWVVDPMHGNLEKIEPAIKTRDFSKIQKEVSLTIKIHGDMSSKLNGIHCELTGEDVTECLGGLEGISTKCLPQKYNSACDPRLSYGQSIEFACFLSEILRPMYSTL